MVNEGEEDEHELDRDYFPAVQVDLDRFESVVFVAKSGEELFERREKGIELPESSVLMIPHQSNRDYFSKENNRSKRTIFFNLTAYHCYVICSQCLIVSILMIQFFLNLSDTFFCRLENGDDQISNRIIRTLSCS